MNARQVFAVVFRVFCQRPMPTNAVSGTATAKVNKRQRWRMADGESWAAAAPAFDLIERRLFGFKNVNQIHLIRPLFLAIFSALIFSTFSPARSAPSAVYLCPAITGHSTLGWQICMAIRIRIRIAIDATSASGSSFYSLYFK